MINPDFEINKSKIEMKHPDYGINKSKMKK